MKKVTLISLASVGILAILALTFYFFNMPSDAKKNEIAIAFATDDNYVLPTCVAMTSAVENAKRTSFYDIYIMHNKELKYENKQKFLSFEKKYKNKCKINLINMGEKYKSLKMKIPKRFGEASMYRISLSELLPEKNKILYLDGDILVHEDLWDFYNKNISDYYIAGTYDYIARKGGKSKTDDHSKEIGLKSYKNYVCSGILLFNLEKFRKDNLKSKFEEFINEIILKKNMTYCDQDMINAVCYDKILILPVRYAVFNSLITAEESYEKNRYAKLYAKNQEEWLNMIEKPVVVHYASPNKPWKSFYSDDRESKKYKSNKIWWSYAKKCDYFEDICNAYREHFTKDQWRKLVG